MYKCLFTVRYLKIQEDFKAVTAIEYQRKQYQTFNDVMISKMEVEEKKQMNEDYNPRDDQLLAFSICS